MVELSQTRRQEKLSLWDVSDPLRVTRLNSRRFSLGLPILLWFESPMKMDDQFIALSIYMYRGNTNFYFFSKKTLDLHWQKTVGGDMSGKFAYGKGLLLLYASKENDKHEECGVIQVYDVTSKTCVREMSIAAKKRNDKFEHNVGFNSKVVGVLEKSSDHRLQYKIKIYDLEAVKNPDSRADDLLFYTLAVDFDIYKRIVVTETEILSLGENTFKILDFSSLDVFQNATNSVTLSSPWRSVWRSKGVDEEPLEPGHHREVYKEVLKYFNELRMDCQAAIKTYPVPCPDIALFTLGFELINDRQLTTLVFNIEEINEKSQEMNDEAVQISGNECGFVMGKAIQLIDVTTGFIINKMKLNIDAIGFHIGGNLLVSVCKMAEHEHLLSVLRIGKSLKLTHIKDLPIGDYIPDECDESLQIDEQFIAVHVPNEHTDMTFNFISLKTFQVERSLTCCCETS